MIDVFSENYASARQRFLAAAERAVVTNINCSLSGPQGEPLCIDVARLGDSDARKALFVLSGTHGVEGYVGSAAQVNWLSSHTEATLDLDVCVFLIHAVNPFGFAWDRRTNEDNVDLNRNFVDFTVELPRNSDYVLLAKLLCPPEWEGPARVEADLKLAAIRESKGIAWFFNANVTGRI